MKSRTGDIRRKSVALLYGVLCHGLFATGVAIMVYQMFFGMSRSWGGLHAPWNWIGNGALLLQFPIAHSFLLTRPGRVALRRIAPKGLGPDLSTTTYVIVASLQIILLFGWWSPSGVIWWQATSAALLVMTTLYAAGWLLLVKAMFDAGITLQTGSLGWWSVFKNIRPAYPRLPTGGLFRLCRQPIYVAFTIPLWTVATWTPDQFVLATTLTAYCLIGPLHKEARFARSFGSEFEAYRSCHPYWIFMPRPTVALYRRNDRSIYEQYADQWWDRSQKWLRTLQNLVPARLAYFDRYAAWPGAVVLDLGCGGGFMSEALAARSAEVIGLDPSPRAIANARNHAEPERLRITYLVAEGEHLPLPDRCVDCVVCVDVLEHVRNLDDVLDEIRRVLRPGGLFLFDTVNRTRLASFVIVFCGESLLRLLPRGTHDPRKFIKPAELDAKLAERGFQDRAYKGLGPRGIDSNGDITFGPHPHMAIMYMGRARLSVTS
jgi:methanethiol S-methyltransferase